MIDEVRQLHEVGFAGGVGGSQKSVLGQRTRGPAAAAVLTEPIVGNLVVDMVGIEKCDEKVHVQERNAAHSSSSVASIISTVTIRPGSCGSSGTPFRTRSLWEGARPFRASSDTTSPAVFFLAR